LNLLVPPLGVDLAIGEEYKDKTIDYGQNKLKILAKTKRVGETVPEHLEVAIKYQGIRLSYLSPIFDVIDVSELTEYIKEKPKSDIRRCIWYLYEWLTEEALAIEESTAAYTNLLDDQYYFTSANSRRHSRTRVINNLLGNKQFCPMVRKTTKMKSLAKRDVMAMAQHHLSALSPFLDTETLGRSVSYLYTKETKSSTEIEKEDTREEKTKKFFRVLKSSGTQPLDKNRLLFVQNQIVQNELKDTDYRAKEIYVGTTRHIGGIGEDIHYIGPKAIYMQSLMDGLLALHEMLMIENTLPVMLHAAIISFGLVYIHPFSDGNGRTHRYLIHDILKSRGEKKQNFIIPVSAAILQRQNEYDQVLESFSTSIMAMIDYDLDEDDHSIVINNDLIYLYRYPDLTEHVEFLYDMMECAITEDLLEEIVFILKFDGIKQIINQQYDLPNQKLDLLVRLLLSNHTISKSKQKLFTKWLTAEHIESIEKFALEKMQQFDRIIEQSNNVVSEAD
ncbi:MAG: Fic family protein, partial [Methylococcales bacterium]|nr:Fic family protein [Methylococcales bacterium]